MIPVEAAAEGRRARWNFKITSQTKIKMGLNNNYSDYGSGSSSGSTSWSSQQDIRWPKFPPQQTMERPKQQSSSYSDLVTGRCTLEDVMREFQMNGSDSPYNPDEDRVWGKSSELSGMGPSGAYVRQKSWPAPERSPAPRLPAPRPTHEPMEFTTSTPVFDEVPRGSPPAEAPVALSAAQARALSALLRSLHDHHARVQQECRFCKNNGERAAYYRSHALKDARGRVACPVLRAFRCARCGASGDHAHTIKYCPLSTNEERIKSAAMMRSVRMASGRRRTNAPAPSLSQPADYVVFGEPSPTVLQEHIYSEPLDPLWAALEQKLML